MGKSNCTGPADLLLFERGDIGSYRLRGALHGFGGDLPIGEIFQQPAALLEGGFMGYPRLLAADSWRALGIFDVEFHIEGGIDRSGSPAQVVRA